MAFSKRMLVEEEDRSLGRPSVQPMRSRSGTKTRLGPAKNSIKRAKRQSNPGGIHQRRNKRTAR